MISANFFRWILWQNYENARRYLKIWKEKKSKILQFLQSGLKNNLPSQFSEVAHGMSTKLQAAREFIVHNQHVAELSRNIRDRVAGSPLSGYFSKCSFQFQLSIWYYPSYYKRGLFIDRYNDPHAYRMPQYMPQLSISKANICRFLSLPSGLKYWLEAEALPSSLEAISIHESQFCLYMYHNLSIVYYNIRKHPSFV